MKIQPSILKALAQNRLQDFNDVVRRYPKLENVPLWIAALATGIVSVLFAQAFNRAEILSQGWHAQPWFILLAPALFVLSWYLVYRLAPEARGSGIPQVMAAIQLVDRAPVGNETARQENSRAVSKLLGVKVSLVKIASALVLVIAGGAIGREGPTIQIAASLFFLVHLRVRKLFPALNAESWIVAGGAAGLAAAFNTPLGGLVYAIEELATKHFTQFRTTLISAVMVSGLAALWLAGNYLYFGHPALDDLNSTDYFFAIIVGLSGGLAGSAFSLGLYQLAQFRKRIGAPWQLALLAAMCGLITLAIAFATHANALGPGREVVIGLIEGRTTPTWDLVLARIVTPMVAYGSGGAGGIFAPSLAAGASLGAFIAHVIQSTHSDLFIMMGMIGFLTGVTHAPFTSMVLMIEMTDRHGAIFPMMMASFSAYAIAKFTGGHSFYEKMRDDFLPAAASSSSSPPPAH